MSIPSHITVLPHRGVLRISGDDCATFLQGLISNDIGLCTPEQPIYAALLTPQGKFLHDLFIYNAGDSYLIDCEAARIDDLMQRLTTYKLRAKIALENVSKTLEVVVSLGDTTDLPDPRLKELGSRAIVTKGSNTNSDFTTYDKHRLNLGITDGSRDMIIGKSTLSDGNFDLLHGINWTKGCYVGQELTARMHHRALVKKRMFPVKISGSAPAAGTIIFYNGAEIGEMRSSANDIGLALLNIEACQNLVAKTEAILGSGFQLTPYHLPWMGLR